MFKELTAAEYGALKADILKRRYGKYAQAWEDSYGDRRLVSPILSQMLEACEAIKSIDNNYCRVAIASKMKEDEARLDEIIGFFTGTVMRSGSYIETPDAVL